MKRMAFIALMIAVAVALTFQTSPQTADAQPAAPSVSSPAADLRVSLVELLTEHATLAIFAMQKGYDGDPDFQPIAAQLDENTVALTDAVRLVYGDQAAAAFEQLWRNHIGFFVDYTVGKATNDAAKQQQAKDDLAGYIDGIATLLSGANPNLPKDAVAQGFTVHVDQLTGTLDAYAAGDYAQAYDLFHESHMHMVMTGTTLGTAIAQQFPDRFSGDAASPAVDLRVTLEQLLTEHAALAIFAMQKGYDSDPDFEAIAAQLDENTVALTDAIRSVFGDQAAAAFEQLWRNHIGFFVDYTVGKATDDAAKQQQAKDNLAGYIDGIATFLSGALPLPKDAVAGAFQVHVDQLIGALDAYAMGEYAGAYDLVHEAHMHMVMAGSTLAGGIAARFPERFGGQVTTPARLPNTGDGSCEDAAADCE